MSKTVQEYKDRIEELENELDTLNMRYLSQVSMWKSLYEETKRRLVEKDKRFIDYLKEKWSKADEAYADSYRNKKSQQIQEIYRKQAGA